MLTTFYPPYHFGGDAMGIIRLSRALVKRGHRVTVIHDGDAFVSLAGREPEQRGTKGGAEEAGHGTRGMDDRVEVVTLRSRLGAVSNLLTQQFGRPVVHGARIRRELEEREVDVTIFHNVSLVGGPGLLGMGRGVTLYMAHEHWLVCPSHVLWRHGREACPGRQCLRCVLHYRRPPQLWRYTGYLERQLGHVDTFIAMSEFSRDKHREFGFPRDMEVVPYFLPEDDESERKEEGGERNRGDRPHPRPYFLFVGRLEKIKGLDDVIPLFGRFGRADLLIAGDGEYAPALRSLAEGNPRVLFLGRVAPADLARYYRHAEALIVPSVCFETFGIIIIEAFRQGTPVIARRIGPFPEIIDASGGGDLFTTGAELEAALGRYLDDPERRARLGEAGRGAFRKLWSEQAVVPRFLEVVRQAAARRGAGARHVVERLTGEETV
jgi:glycosyltransferase involved in cell wall biosynthesis